MRRTDLLLVALTVVGLLSAACAAGRGDVEVGDCFRNGTATKFEWDTEVSCDQPHTVEVFAVRDVSAAPLGQFARGDLDDKGSPARQQYLQLLTEVCEPEWSRYTGYDKLGSSLAPDAVVLPALYGDMTLEAAPEQEWTGGKKIVVCYQVLGRPGAQGEEPISVQRPVLRALSDDPAAVPIEVRDCARTLEGDQGSEQRVPCTAEHDREYLGHLNLVQFIDRVPGLDQTFLNGFDSTTARKDWDLLDGLCTQIFGRLVSERQDVTLLAQAYTDDESWGWVDGGPYHTACFAKTTVQVTSSVLG